MARVSAKRFTVYDAMEARGAFDDNPANPVSDRYSGPVKYPVMLYHPDGEMVQVEPGEIITTPLGPKVVGQRFELVNRIAADAEQEARLLEAGWHRHPSDAMRAGGLAAPEKSSAEKIDTLQEQIAKLQAQLAAANAQVLAATGRKSEMASTQGLLNVKPDSAA